ncbi:MAG: hypothetical protein HYU77_03730 [Betaproteobacteria bacterium]|nr:hypothetical protein [Betaproteobacteria bacterium]
MLFAFAEYSAVMAVLASRNQAITKIMEGIPQLMAPPEPTKQCRIGFVQTD